MVFPLAFFWRASWKRSKRPNLALCPFYCQRGFNLSSKKGVGVREDPVTQIEQIGAGIIADFFRGGDGLAGGLPNFIDRPGQSGQVVAFIQAFIANYVTGCDRVVPVTVPGRPCLF